MKKRHGVLTLLCVVSVITFLDRLALPLAESGVRADLHLNPRQWGWVLSSYVLANALFEIPSGALGDRNGQRLELTRITAWWSAFTALTGWCRNFFQMAGARFLFGVGAAGAYPNAAGVISRWFPKKEHAEAQGYVWGASRLGSVLAFLILVPIEERFGWRAMFWLLGIVGFAWSVTWWTWFRTNPAEMPGIDPEELAVIREGQLAHEHGKPSVPWRRLLRLPHLWAIVLAYFCYAWGSWFYFGWFTAWLRQDAGLTVRQIGIYASFPFIMGLLGNIVGGILSEKLVERRGRKSAYRRVTSVCLAISAALLLSMSMAQSRPVIIALAALCFGVMDLMLPSAWAMCMSLGGGYGGTATGIMNTSGNLGGWVCTVVFGYVVAATGNYNIPLRIIAFMVLAAAALFSRIDCTKGLADANG